MSDSPEQLGESRDAFLARIRQGLGRDAAVEAAGPPPEVDESLMRLASVEDDLPALFAERAGEVGLEVHRVSPAGVAAKVVELLKGDEVGRVALALGEGPLTYGVEADLDAASIGLADWRDVGVGGLFDVDAGVTDVAWGLAETGTLVLHTDAERGRAMSLAPPVHIALLRVGDILPDMIDLWRTLDERREGENRFDASSLVFITGPSKTSDIEGVLVTGVHGPRVVHVILIDELG